MKKKIILGAIALVAVAGSVAGLSAFEAHVINVTARIENALNVPTEELDFGTVFPQEHLDLPLSIALSQSFLDEDRVDDVEYRIRQKPKCGVTEENGTVLNRNFPTATGHVSVDDQGVVTIDCGPAPEGFDDSFQDWGVLPSLCEYISKEGPDRNDETLPSFHTPWEVVGTGEVDDPYGIRWNNTLGHLAKSEGDEEDLWTIDLAVPCFGNHCAQDWEAFVTSINPDALPADQWVQDIENEHKIFGCDLWVEVFGISLPPGLGCTEKADVMLVLDRSGSVSGDLGTLKTAAGAFVTALNPEADGAHLGIVSFAATATLDLHLTDDATAASTTIDGLVAGGLTNLEDALQEAQGELDDGGDGHDRADVDSPDFIVLITDGAPTASNGPGTNAEDAIAAATVAKAAGTTIFVVGVGTDSGTADFLANSIATDPGHYFDATDFDDLEAILENVVTCEDPQITT